MVRYVRVCWRQEVYLVRYRCAVGAKKSLLCSIAIAIALLVPTTYLFTRMRRLGVKLCASFCFLCYFYCSLFMKEYLIFYSSMSRYIAFSIHRCSVGKCVYLYYVATFHSSKEILMHGRNSEKYFLNNAFQQNPSSDTYIFFFYLTPAFFAVRNTYTPPCKKGSAHAFIPGGTFSAADSSFIILFIS